MTQERVSTVEPGNVFNAPGGKARRELLDTMVILRRPPTPYTVRHLWFHGDHRPRKVDDGTVFAPERALIAAPHGVVVGEDEDGGSERVHLLSEDLTIEHHA